MKKKKTPAVTALQFLKVKGLENEYRQWKNEVSPPKDRYDYHRKRYLAKKDAELAEKIAEKRI